DRSILKPDSLSEPGRQESVTAELVLYLTTCATVRPAGAPRAADGLDWVTVTWSNTALAVVPLLCAVRARPTSTFVPMLTVWGPPRLCQAPWLWPLLTSMAQKPVKVLPTRSSRSQTGAAWSPKMWLSESDVRPPVSVRHWNTGSLWPKLGPVSSMKASRAPALVFSRIMTPALVQKSGLLRLATRATISPSPESGL